MPRFLLMSAALSAMLSVCLGAFAAHGLKSRLSETLLATFQTGVHYQFMHSLAVILVVILYRQQAQGLLLWSAVLFFAGILLFSGSLYGLSLTQFKAFGPITPLGGLCFIAGWLSLFIAVWRSHP
jgi:uncharacterized membrane protein YgdD (TMEM256/DUF423 family)